MIDFAIRRLQSSDSLHELTAMLHRAFERMAQLGVNCQAIDQSPATTRQRAERGDCFVAIADRRVVGTVTIQPADASAAIRRYRSPEVASIHQFAVEPSFQGAGIGLSMLRVATTWAKARQLCELALDTPACATDLLAWYTRQGFKLTEVLQVTGRGYESAVLVKRLASQARGTLARAWPARHPAEIAAYAEQCRVTAGRRTR